MNIITPRRICVNAGGWIYYLLKLSEYYELRMIRTDGSDDHRVCDVCHVLDTVRGFTYRVRADL